MNALPDPRPASAFVDIHCHLIPGIDDGAQSYEDSLRMARMAVSEGIATIIATPHQLGSFHENSGDLVRTRIAELQQRLMEENVPLQVLAGADVRIEDDLVPKIRSGQVLSLGDHGKHVLLELPHELYFPIEPLLDRLAHIGMVGILSHPERNQGLLRRPVLVEALVEYGCLMQVTSGSLVGSFGPNSREMAEWMVAEGLAHFLATDAHGPKTRRPLMRRAFQQAAKLSCPASAERITSTNPAAVSRGHDVPAGRLKADVKPRKLFGWWKRVKAA